MSLSLRLSVDMYIVQMHPRLERSKLFILEDDKHKLLKQILCGNYLWFDSDCNIILNVVLLSNR